MAICFIENVYNDHPTGTLTLQFQDRWQKSARNKDTRELLKEGTPLTFEPGSPTLRYEEFMVQRENGTDDHLLVTTVVSYRGTGPITTKLKLRVRHLADSWDYLEMLDEKGQSVAMIEVGSMGNTKGVNWSGWTLSLNSQGKVQVVRDWRQGLPHKSAVQLAFGIAGGVVAAAGIGTAFVLGIAGILTGGATAGTAVATGTATAGAIAGTVATGAASTGTVLATTAVATTAYLGIVGLITTAAEGLWTVFEPDSPPGMTQPTLGARPAVDVAAGKPATASSASGEERRAERANDGRPEVDGGWEAAPSDRRSFWQVDLGAPVSLDRIRLVTRQDVDEPAARRNFQIWASNHADMSLGHAVLLVQGDEQPPFRGVLDVTVFDPTPYRYLAVVKTSDGPLSVAKLGAFARPPDLAAGKPAACSSFHPEYPPQRANDGGSIANGGWACAPGHDRSWWQVDLGEARRLSGVDLVTRQDMDQPVMREGFEIWASNHADMSEGHVVLARRGPRPMAFRGVFTVDLDDPTPYRYIAAVKTIPGEFSFAKLCVYGA